MTSRTILGLSVSLLASASCAYAQDTEVPAHGELTEVQGVIDSMNALYIQAYADANGLALAAVYDANGARLGSNGQYSRGTEAIAAAVGEFVGRVGPVAVTLETADLWLLDDRAYETGEWSYTFTPESEAERTIGGRYVTIWQRQAAGGWKIWADMGVPGTSLSN